MARHGPHQTAQKSTSVGFSFFSTSVSKLASVNSRKLSAIVVSSADLASWLAPASAAAARCEALVVTVWWMGWVGCRLRGPASGARVGVAGVAVGGSRAREAGPREYHPGSAG